MNAANLALVLSAANAAIAPSTDERDRAPRLLRAEAQRANAYRPDLIQANQHESETILRSPETGTVLEVNGVVGDTVSAGNSGITNPATNGRFGGRQRVHRVISNSSWSCIVLGGVQPVGGRADRHESDGDGSPSTRSQACRFLRRSSR